MICPQCKAEYRRGFTVCADCDVPLVESPELTARSVVDTAPEDRAERERAAGTPGDPNTDPFCSFWKGTDLRVCTEICTVLDEAAIPHNMIRRQDHLFNWSNHAPYQIGVPASLYEKAELAIKEAFGTDDDGGEPLPRLNEQNRESFDRLVNQPLQEKLQQRPEEAVPGFFESLLTPKGWERKPDESGGQTRGIPAADEGEWYPEDATSLAWDGEPAEVREIIEMALKENDIWMRWEMHDEKPRLFVLPEDEERAREIVREILEGQPPE
jgi:hypothetical protein